MHMHVACLKDFKITQLSRTSCFFRISINDQANSPPDVSREAMSFMSREAFANNEYHEAHYGQCESARMSLKAWRQNDAYHGKWASRLTAFVQGDKKNAA